MLRDDMNKEILNEIKTTMNKIDLRAVNAALLKEIEAYHTAEVYKGNKNIFELIDLRDIEEKGRYYYGRILAINNDIIAEDKTLFRMNEDIIRKGEEKIDVTLMDHPVNSRERAICLFYQALHDKYKTEKLKVLTLGLMNNAPRTLNIAELDESDLSIAEQVNYFIRCIRASDMINSLWCLVSRLVSDDIGNQ